MANLLSPRTIHRPWEQDRENSEAAVLSPSSSSSSSSAAMVFAFPSLPVSSQSAPATPSGLTHSSSVHPHLLYPRNHHPNAPLLHPSFYIGSPSPFIAHHHSPSTGSDNALNPPLSPCLPNSLGSPFSPFPWSAGPFSMQSFPAPLPSMPYGNANGSSSGSIRSSTPKSPHISPLSKMPSTSCNGLVKNENANPAAHASPHKVSPPKKKRKPPPISIDSSISNFSAEAAQLQNMMNMSGAGLMSPTMSSGPLPSPLMSAAHFHHFHEQQQQQNNLNNAIRYLYEGGPLTPAIPSSGYASIDGQLFSPLNFAFLCFFPGTKLKFLCAEDSPAKVDWQPVEVLRENNIKLNFQGLHLINTVKGESESGSSLVELTFKTVEAPGTPDNAAIHIKALASPSHPFYEFQKGWVSLDPLATRDIHGLQCNHLKLGDNVSCNPPERMDLGWNHFDLPNNLLAEWNVRNRRAMSMDSLGLHDPRSNSGWSALSTPMPTTPRETKPRVKKEKKEKKDENKAKRPMNAFMLFAQRYRVLYTQRFPGRDNRAISCLLGDHWKSLENDERQKFTDEAKNLAEMYKEKNPDCWKRRSRSRSDSEAQLIVVDDPLHQQIPLSSPSIDPHFNQSKEAELADPRDYSQTLQFHAEHVKVEMSDSN